MWFLCYKCNDYFVDVIYISVDKVRKFDLLGNNFSTEWNILYAIYNNLRYLKVCEITINNKESDEIFYMCVSVFCL